MSKREKIIFLSNRNGDSEFQEKVIDKEDLWHKIKKVYDTSIEGKKLIEEFKIEWFPAFVLRNNEVLSGGVLGHNNLRDKLDLRKYRGK